MAPSVRLPSKEVFLDFFIEPIPGQVSIDNRHAYFRVPRC
jgi:hypothetical protein